MNSIKMPAPSKILSIAIAAIFGALVYMITDNKPPYEWTFGEIVPNPTSNGAQVQVHWKIKISRHCPGLINRQVVGPVYDFEADGSKRTSALIRNYDPFPAFAPTFVDPDLWVTFNLPTNLEPGNYIYRVSGDYNCNLLQRFWPLHVKLPEIKFKVSG